jgi:F-type H+-transporting ATPase subunit gamma
MPQDLRSIRRKIRTVRNIWQITRAMKMVAAARVRRLQRQVQMSRLYWHGLWDMAEKLAAQLQDLEHPYLSDHEPQRVLLAVVSGDKGLCGSYNSMVFRRAEVVLKEHPIAAVVTVGDRARRWAEKMDLQPVASFGAFGGKQSGNVEADVARALRQAYEKGDYDGVRIVATPFVSMLYNLPREMEILPLRRAEVKAAPVNYIFEPEGPALLKALLPRAIEARIAQAVIEAAAAEQAARMAAMTTASDNAEQLGSDLTRMRNRMRQAEITTGILEVVSGANAQSAG